MGQIAAFLVKIRLDLPSSDKGGTHEKKLKLRGP